MPAPPIDSASMPLRPSPSAGPSSTASVSGDSFAISPHGSSSRSASWWGRGCSGVSPRARRLRREVNAIVFWSLIGAIIGSRLFYVIAHYSEFDDVGQMLAIWHGGISLLGGIAGAVIINAFRVRRRGLPVLPGGRRRWLPHSRSGSRWDGSATSSSATTSAGPPVGSWPGTYEGGTLAPPFAWRSRTSSHLPGGAPGRPPADDRSRRGVKDCSTRRARDRRRRGRPSDGALRHDHRRGPVRVPVVRA